MPTLKYFAEHPQFPSDVAVADIPTLSFETLKANSSDQESLKLFEACQEHGFFLLNLADSEEGEQLLKNAEGMFKLCAETLNLDRKVLDRYAYHPPKDLLGYKSAGKLKTDDGKLDAMEMYTIGQDDMVGTLNPPRQNPEPIEATRQNCEQFFRRANAAVCVILDRLDGLMGLESGTLAKLSPIDKPSDTSLRMLLTRPQPQKSSKNQEDSSDKALSASTSTNTDSSSKQITLGGHTDIGTITLLFHVAGGLQILPSGLDNNPSNWRYIRPAPCHALINIGDTMVEWTGGLLRSSLHRVVTAPGAQANVPRQSLAYLVRPMKEASMRRLKSMIESGDGGGKESRQKIPELAEGEMEDTRSVSEWAAWRAQQIIKGELKPRTTGGIHKP